MAAYVCREVSEGLPALHAMWGRGNRVVVAGQRDLLRLRCGFCDRRAGAVVAFIHVYRLRRHELRSVITTLNKSCVLFTRSVNILEAASLKFKVVLTKNFEAAVSAFELLR